MQPNGTIGGNLGQHNPYTPVLPESTVEWPPADIPVGPIVLHHYYGMTPPAERPKEMRSILKLKQDPACTALLVTDLAPWLNIKYIHKFLVRFFSTSTVLAFDRWSRDPSKATLWVPTKDARWVMECMHRKWWISCSAVTIFGREVPYSIGCEVKQNNKLPTRANYVATFSNQL